jgi:hypothetical protein
MLTDVAVQLMMGDEVRSGTTPGMEKKIGEAILFQNTAPGLPLLYFAKTKTMAPHEDGGCGTHVDGCCGPYDDG